MIRNDFVADLKRRTEVARRDPEAMLTEISTGPKAVLTEIVTGPIASAIQAAASQGHAAYTIFIHDGSVDDFEARKKTWDGLKIDCTFGDDSTTVSEACSAMADAVREHLGLEPTTIASDYFVVRWGKDVPPDIPSA